MAYGPKVSDSALAIGGYSFWNQAGWFPTNINMDVYNNIIRNSPKVEITYILLNGWILWYMDYIWIQKLYIF